MDNVVHCFFGEAEKRARIRELNDALRTTFTGGVVVCSAGFAALPAQERSDALFAVRAFNRFDDKNDSWGEQDFEEVYAGGERLFFKIDYYDREMVGASPDPSDPAVTTRVLTITLASGC